MLETHTEIINKLGLHARAATKFANTAKHYSCDIRLSLNGKCIDGKSIMSLMLLAASKGTKLCLQTEGKDETEAMEALLSLIANRFDEEE